MNKPRKTKTGLWQIRVTDERGDRRKKSFASYDDAVYAANAERARVGEVKRGMRSPTPPDRPVDDLFDLWIAQRVPQKRSGYHDVSIIRRHLRPAFGALILRELSVEHVDRFICDRLHLDVKTVANHIVLLVSMLNLAHEIGWLLRVPKIRKPKIRFFSKDYRYLRNDEEVARFLRAAHDEGLLVYVLFAMAVFTGMREGELAGLLWSDIDFERRLITVDKSFNGPTKAGDVRYVPILDPLLPILQRWRLVCPGALVFPNERGGMHGKSARVFQEVLHRVLDAAGFPKAERAGRLRRYVVFHDLRHTFASHWVMRGGDIFKLQKILGHKSMQMTQRYAHLAPETYASDHGRLGSAAPATTTTVIPLPRKAEGAGVVHSNRDPVPLAQPGKAISR